VSSSGTFSYIKIVCYVSHIIGCNHRLHGHRLGPRHFPVSVRMRLSRAPSPRDDRRPRLAYVPCTTTMQRRRVTVWFSPTRQAPAVSLSRARSTWFGLACCVGWNHTVTQRLCIVAVCGTYAYASRGHLSSRENTLTITACA
jgi:hypothetical protein